jgi:hypothetical protein
MRLIILTAFMSSVLSISFAQKPVGGEDANLNLLFNSPMINQYGSDNILFFNQKQDPDLTPLSINNLRVLQQGDKNTLVLSDLRENVRLDISQRGFNNLLHIENVTIPMRIEQFGGMEITINGTSFLPPTRQ